MFDGGQFPATARAGSRQAGRGRAPFRVLGIDPGLTRLGYGIVETSGERLQCLQSGTLATSPGPSSGRLNHLFDGLARLVGEWRPDAMAVERVFLKANLKTGIPAIQAWGVALLAGAREGLEVTEYSPAEVKQTITGVGTAGKDQVRYMVEKLLTGAVAPDSPDAADALAVAITHLHSRRDMSISGHPAATGAG